MICKGVKQGAQKKGADALLTSVGGYRYTVQFSLLVDNMATGITDG